MGVGARPGLRRAARGTLAAAGVACCAGCCAWAVSGAGWLVDLAAVFTGHIAAAAVVVGVCAAAVRARAGVVLALVAVAAGGIGLVRGRTLVLGDPGEGPSLRVLVYNSHALNTDHAGAEGVIERAGADVVVLIEPEIGLSRAIRWDGALSEVYPHRVQRAWVEGRVSPIIVLSKLPLEAVAVGGHEGDDERAMAVVVDGAWGVVAGQPRSPRTAGRWAMGNEEAVVIAGLARGLAGRGLPVAVCVDLNSTPSGHRGAVLRGAGLRAGKPLLRMAGTFPAWSVWPGRIGIDDVWVGGGARVRAWGLAGSGGSDHEGVVVVLGEETQR